MVQVNRVRSVRGGRAATDLGFRQVKSCSSPVATCLKALNGLALPLANAALFQEDADKDERGDKSGA
jgi:hypothetical protein